MLTAEDKALLEKKGISEEKIAEQLACFEKGFPFLKLDGAASRNRFRACWLQQPRQGRCYSKGLFRRLYRL